MSKAEIRVYSGASTQVGSAFSSKKASILRQYNYRMLERNLPICPIAY